ncbi:hypothetical protein ACM6PT_37540, partial [Klebsiella pneumoniae]
AAPAQAQTLGKKHAPRSADLLQPEARDALAARRQIDHTPLQPKGATIQLGGQAVFLSPRDTQLGRGEPIGDSARVMSRMLDGVMIRTFAHATLTEFAAHSKV